MLMQSSCMHFTCINIPKLNPYSSSSMKVIKLTWTLHLSRNCPQEQLRYGKGLNTESNNPQRATATVLVGLAGGEHCRDEHTVLPRFRALLER